MSATVLASFLELECFLPPVSVRNYPERCTPSLSPPYTEYYKINEIIWVDQVSPITRELIITSYIEDYRTESTEAELIRRSEGPLFHIRQLLSQPQSRIIREIDDRSPAPPPADLIQLDVSQ
jgi:hypothetical protein